MIDTEIELIKIGEIISNEENDKSRKTIKIGVGDPILNYYSNKLKKKTNYRFIDYQVESIKMFKNYSLFSHKSKLEIGQFRKGKLFQEVQIGLNIILSGNEVWGTTKIVEIVDEVIITLNSVYAIHNIQLSREIKLNDLGL